MDEVFRCDRCGETFSKFDDNDNFVEIHKLEWGYEFKYPERMFNGFLLCRDCMNELNSFLKKSESPKWILADRYPIPTVLCTPKKIKGDTIVIGADENGNEFPAIKKEGKEWLELIAGEQGHYFVSSDRIARWRFMTSEESRKYSEIQRDTSLML